MFGQITPARLSSMKKSGSEFKKSVWKKFYKSKKKSIEQIKRLGICVWQIPSRLTFQDSLLARKYNSDTELQNLRFVAFVNNTSLFVGSIAGCVVLVAAVVVLIILRRKKSDREQEQF